MKTPRPGAGPDVGEGSGLSSASLVPPASPQNGHSRGGTGFAHGLACFQVWGDNHQERDARGGEGEWRLGGVFRLWLLETFQWRCREEGARLGGRLNGEGSAAVRVPGRHRDPEDVFHPRDTESARGEQDSAQCPVGEEQRPERTKARAQGEEIPLRGAP